MHMDISEYSPMRYLVLRGDGRNISGTWLLEQYNWRWLFRRLKIKLILKKRNWVLMYKKLKNEIIRFWIQWTEIYRK